MNSKSYKYTNSLIKETSPYLLQHAHNPVNWYAWGDDAFKIAKKENKLVLISIGYAACHWCHVMEHKSFENEAIASIMNDNFICIKVDREERPDIDQVYMSAVQLLSGSGGWPLNCFALPDGRPIYGGTYFTPEQWTQVLTGLTQTYKDEPEKIHSAANELEKGVKNYELISTKAPKTKFITEHANKMFLSWKPYFDTEWGGNKRAPKFPMPSSFEFLLNFAFHTNNNEALTHLNLSLSKIALGGIYDHVGGGFARYSVDTKWKVPHFEKMLYDNGQLISLYAKALKNTKNLRYQNVINESLEFIKREMTTAEGAFYSSFDADSEGIEGKFYVWSKIEIEKYLGKDSEWFSRYFNITEEGNWEEGNILWVTKHNDILTDLNLSEQDFSAKLNKATTKLLTIRSKRIHPGLDDKILCSWNSLMSIAYIDAYQALGKPEYLNTALNNAHFILTKLYQTDGNLHRNYKNGKSSINGFLDDYSITIQLFCKLFETTFDEHWLTKATELTKYVFQHFYDNDSGLFFFTSDLDKALVARKMEITDNVIPSSNSIMANNLHTLGTILANSEWVNIAEQMLSNIIHDAENHPSYYGNWGVLLNKLSYPFFEVVIIGENAIKLKNELEKHYLPNVLIIGSVVKNDRIPLFTKRWIDGKTLIYVCKENVCQLPVDSVQKALELIN